MKEEKKSILFFMIGLSEDGTTSIDAISEMFKYFELEKSFGDVGEHLSIVAMNASASIIDRIPECVEAINKEEPDDDDISGSSPSDALFKEINRDRKAFEKYEHITCLTPSCGMKIVKMLEKDFKPRSKPKSSWSSNIIDRMIKNNSQGA